ncbi:MAG: type II toxin-antitoxin system RelE family toxin [Planctomycetaceae bacterium]
MGDYTIVFARSARRELEDLPTRLAARILARIESLTMAPRPPGCVKLTGRDNLWRIRVGDYRIIYSIDDVQRLVEVMVIRHRRDAYR